MRLTGVDTPETKHPTKAVEHFGAEASAYTQAALEGQRIELEQDRTGDTQDRYGRLLRYVHLNGHGLQRPADPRGLRPCDPGLSLLAESAVYPARTGSAEAREGPVVPPLNPRPCELAVSNLPGDCRGLIRRKSHPADCLFTHRRCPGGALPVAIRAVIVSCTERARESGGAALGTQSLPWPACPGAWTAPDWGEPLAGGVCHGPCRLPVLTGPGRILAFLPCQVLITAAWLL